MVSCIWSQGTGAARKMVAKLTVPLTANGPFERFPPRSPSFVFYIIYVLHCFLFGGKNRFIIIIIALLLLSPRVRRRSEGNSSDAHISVRWPSGFLKTNIQYSVNDNIGTVS